MEILKLLSTSEIFAQIISFLILLFLLRIFAWKKVLKLLDERKEKMASGFKQIEDAKLELEALKKDYKVKLDGIDAAARVKIHEAIAEGRVITEEIRKKAFEQSEEIITQARDNIKYELTKAKEELKEKIVDLTIEATKNLIEEKFTGEDDERLVRGFLKDLDQMDLK